MEVKAIPASVFFAADVSNVDTNVRFHADLQTYTVFTGLDPQLFMAQFVSWEIPTKENGWTGRNIARWRNAEYDRLWRKAETEMDPVKRAALFIKMNDLVVQKAVVIPVTWRNVLHAAVNNLAGDRAQLVGLDLRPDRLLVPARVARAAPAPAVDHPSPCPLP